jgi:hypothetical protein
MGSWYACERHKINEERGTEINRVDWRRGHMHTGWLDDGLAYLRLWYEFRRERAVLELVEVECGEERVVQNLAGGPFLHADAPGDR